MPVSERNRHGATALPDWRQARTLTVGIGEFAVSADPKAVLMTHALGSCVAVCLWDQDARVAGLLHFLLPDSATHAGRSRSQPEAFADTGIPLLFEEAYRHGLKKTRAIVRLVGGAELSESTVTSLQIARRNLAAARNVLWVNGVSIDREVTGGLLPRSVYMPTDTGRLYVKSGTEYIILD